MSSASITDVINRAGKPDFLKTAALHDDGEYAFNTKEATYISFVRTLVKNASPDIVEDCDLHAKFWGIMGECENAKIAFEQINQSKVASADLGYAMQWTSPEGVKLEKYAAYDNESTLDAALNFYENRTKYPYDCRCKTAEALLQKAAQYDVNLPAYLNTYLEKAAALGAVGVSNVDDVLVQRGEVYPVEYREEFNKVAELLEKFVEQPELRSDSDFIKAAMTAVDSFDAAIRFQHGLIEEGLIDSRLTASNLQKMASEDKFLVTLVNGNEIDCRTLTKEALEAVNPELVTMDEKKLAEVLPTLPRGDADLLSRLTA
jgi:hypothetical protein